MNHWTVSHNSFVPSSRSPIGPAPKPRDRIVAVPSAVLGTTVFVVTEVMFFVSLLSAFFVVKSRSVTPWMPPEDIRLPLLATVANTLVLLASGVLMVFADSQYRKDGQRALGARLFLQATLLGALFVVVQGAEWVRLIQYGMTIQSGLFGATFFLLIGSHGLHALAAIVIMGSMWPKIKQQSMHADSLRAMAIFWLFIVGVWPLLFGVVYFE